MNVAEFKTQSSRRRSAFTLVELLVVIASIGILAALLLAAMGADKEGAIRVRCLGNIKQVNLETLSYGGDNRDRLPLRMNVDNPCFVPKALADYMRRDQIAAEVLFDPGLKLTTRLCGEVWDVEAFWATGTVGDVAHRQMGYVTTVPQTGFLGGWIYSREQNSTIRPQPPLTNVGGIIQAGPPPKASERVLTAGPVLSMGPYPSQGLTLKQTYVYAFPGTRQGPGGVTTPNLPEGSPYWPAARAVPGRLDCTNILFWYQTAHLDRRGRYPTGDNDAMLDGSAKWRKFEQMLPRGGVDWAGDTGRYADLWWW